MRDLTLRIMDFLKDNWFKVGILIAILLIAYSVYQVLVVRPDIERQEAAQAKMLADIEESARKEQAKSDLNSCLTSAETNYSNQWYRECKSSNLLSKQCIDLHDLSYEEYLKKYSLTEEQYKTARGITSTSTLAGLFDYFGRYENECSCRLILSLADRINADLKDSKNACYSLYPQN